MDFDYVVNRHEKEKICFGSSLERKTLEADVKGLFSRHARKNMKENLRTIMPGMYEYSNVHSAMSSLINRPTSTLGTVLGGRTAQKKDFTAAESLPGPGTYNIATTFLQEFRINKAPFNSKTKRITVPKNNTPGVGQYSVAPVKCVSVPFAYSFGGRKTLLPAVKMKCGPFHLDTCERCGVEPEGDYWFQDPKEVRKPHTKNEEKTELKKEEIFLCRACYNIEKIENKIFSKLHIRAFKKIRNCSKVHFHDGCKAKLYLVPPKEIKQLSVKEGYLSQFFK